MGNYSFLILVTCIISLIGTMMGALLGVIAKNPSSRFLSGTVGMASGVMISIVILDLIPQAVLKLKFSYFIMYFCIGVGVVIIINKFIIIRNNNMSTYKKVAILVIIALGIHNFPEGLIMGCGLGIGSTLGIKMSLIIAIHDIPEGIAAAAPLMAANEKVYKILFYSFLSALPTLLGAFVGLYLGMVSKETLGILFAFVSGIMSYIVCGEMMPSAKKLNNKFTSSIGFSVGVLIGGIITIIL